jgi:hypothetical protein
MSWVRIVRRGGSACLLLVVGIFHIDPEIPEIAPEFSPILADIFQIGL